VVGLNRAGLKRTELSRARAELDRAVRLDIYRYPLVLVPCMQASLVPISLFLACRRSEPAHEEPGC
jgi:hypothetical protein